MFLFRPRPSPTGTTRSHLKARSPPPKVTALAEGKGVKIVSPSGVDYVFVSPKTITYRDNEVAFEGKISAAQGHRARGRQGSEDCESLWRGLCFCFAQDHHLPGQRGRI